MFVTKIDDDVYSVLALEYGINKRCALGGTSQETVNQALYSALESLDKLEN